MIVVWRWWYWLGLGGIALIGWSTVEAKHATASGTQPIEVSLADLAAGAAIAQPYVRLGEHVALYADSIGWGPRRGNRLDWSIYPVVPPDHGYLEAWRKLAERYPDPDDVPAGAIPRLEQVHALVLTKRWRTTDANPGGNEQVAGLEGLRFRYDELDRDESSVVNELLPDFDPERLWVLEEGRRPRPLWLCWALGAAGVVLLVQAVRLFRGKRAPAPVPAEPDAG